MISIFAIWRLTITLVSPSEHYYGRLKGYVDGEYKERGVLHPLTRKEAKYINNKNGTLGFSLYRQGDLDHRFESEAQVIRFAKQQYRKQFPACIVLMQGSPASCGPKEFIDGDIVGFKRYQTVLKKAADVYEELLDKGQGCCKEAAQLIRAFDKLCEIIVDDHEKQSKVGV